MRITQNTDHEIFWQTYNNVKDAFVVEQDKPAPRMRIDTDDVKLKVGELVSWHDLFLYFHFRSLSCHLSPVTMLLQLCGSSWFI